MLQPFLAIAEPYFLHACLGAQKIDVPVRSGRGVRVMVYAGKHASGAECAADVNVEPAPDAHVAKLPDTDIDIGV